MNFRRPRSCGLLLMLVFLSLSLLEAGPIRHAEKIDQDRDGLDDGFEEALLARFAPRFWVSDRECAVLPSSFAAGSERAIPVSTDGTVYGQVFQVDPPGEEGHFIEIHYYHLWDRDCGDFGHPYDAEYVSALLRSDNPAGGPSSWTARYWYAAAHEGTLCDASNAAQARAVRAEYRGPEVWISRGKHASFLSRDLCNRVGCGGDRCDEMSPISTRRIVNVGEPWAPLNGAEWINDPGWPLPSKLKPDFDDTSLEPFASLDPDGARFVNNPLPPTKELLLAGNLAIESLLTSQVHTGSALSTAGRHGGRAVRTGLGAAARSFWLSLRAAGRFADPEPEP